MNFILKHDLLTKIKAKELAILTEDTANADEELKTSISAAQKEIKSYISYAYDVPLAMAPIWYFDYALRSIGDIVVLYSENEFVDGNTYVLNEIVLSESGYVYSANSEGVISAPPLNHNSISLDWALLGKNLSFYKSLVDDNDSAPNEITDWESLSEDPRDSLLKRFLIDLTLYDLHARIKPRQIPEHRIQLRDDAIKLLKLSANPRNNVFFDLPLIDHGEQSGRDMTFGSNKKTTHSY